MPRIGDIEVSDADMAAIGRAAAARAAAAAPRPGVGSVLAAATEGTARQVAAALPYQFDVLTQRQVSPEAEARYRQGLSAASTAFARAAPASVSDVLSGRVGFGRAVAENLAASAPQTVAVLGGGLAGGLVGGVPGAAAGAVAVGTPLFSASNVARAVETEGSLSQQAALRSLAAAPVQAAADAAIARFLPGAGKVLGDLASTQTGGFLRRTATSMLEAAGTEAVTEAAQQLGERYSAGLSISDADAVGEYVNAAVVGGVLGGVLGAGGGFRRTNAVAKPADMVSTDDINAHVDGILDGSLRALPAPSNIAIDEQGNQIALPSPEMVGRQPSGPEVTGGPAIPMVNPTDFVVDSAGRIVPAGPEGVRDLVIEQNLPQPSGPTDAELLARIQQATAQPEIPAGVTAQPPAPFTGAFAPPAAATSPAALANLPVGETPRVELPLAARPFQGVDIADLNKARRAKNADPAVVSAIDEELAARKAEDPFAGIPMNQDIVKLRDATPEERVAGVIKLLEEGDSRAGTFRLAERLGIDVNAPAAPTAPVEPAGTPRMTPQAASGADFEAQWTQLKKDAGIQRLRGGQELLGGSTPANLGQAQAQVFRALASDVSSAEVSQVEKMARKMGLVTDDDAMDVTPLGRQAFLATPEGLEETVLAAQQQGYTGAQASIFDRGVRAQTAGETTTPTFTNFGDMAAFQAGKIWAEDFVQNAETRTAAQTEAIRARQGGRVTGTAVPREQTRLELSPQQVQQQSLNRLIDAADLRGVNDTDVAELRRMVRGGATPDQVGQALQQVQGGQSLFAQPERGQFEAAPARPERRAQPLFKEMNVQVRESKTIQRAETEAAVRAFEMRSLIQFALAEKGITQARADRLNQMLDEGKVEQVAGSMKNFLAEARISGDVDPQFEQFMTGKDFMGALGHMIAHAPSRYHREIMSQVKTLAQGLQRAGVNLQFKIVGPSDPVPEAMSDGLTRAFTTMSRQPAQATVYLQSAEMGAHAGMNYQIAAHEMIHAVTMALLQQGNTPGVYGNTKLGRAVKDLYDLQHTIADHFVARREAGNLSAFERAFLFGDNNALDNVDEILAWGLTNPDMQRYLASIEYKPKQSVFGRLVELLRNVLGLDAKYDTALTELLRVAEQITGTEQAELRSAWQMNWPGGFEEAALVAPLIDASGGTPSRTAVGANEELKGLVQQAGDAFDRVVASDFVSSSRDSVRKFGLGLFSRNHLNQLYARMVPGILDNTHAHEARSAVRNVFQLMGANASQNIDKLRQAGTGQAVKDHERINNLMQAAQYGIDGAKTWEEHGYLFREPNADNLKQIWQQAHQDYGTLARHGTVGLFEEARAANEAQNLAHMVGQLYDRIAGDEQYRVGIPGGTVSPADRLLDTEGLTTARAMREHMAEELDARVAEAKAYLDTQSQSAAALSPADRADVASRQAPLKAILDEIAKHRRMMDQRPYFHLPRFGDHFAAFTIVRGEDGNVDTAKLKLVAEALEKLGVKDVQLSTDNTNPRVMIRTDNKSTAGLMGSLGLELESKGLVEQGTTLYGPRSRVDNYGLGGRVPDYIAQALEKLETDPVFQPDPSMTKAEREVMAAQLSAAKQVLVDGWLDMQPDNSLSKVLAKRKNVQGASDDMIRGFAHRQNLGAVGIASLMTRPKFGDALRSMRATVEESHEAGNELDPYITSQVVNEVRRRELDNPVNETADSFDKLRAVANASYLGLNPSSSVINMTALGTTVLPELAKKSGYVKSFHAMRRASVQAYSILRAAFLDAQKRGGAHRADLALTENVLAEANLSTDVREFVRRRVAAGDIDLVTMARALGQIASGKADTKLDQALRYGSAFNLYSEAFARLVAVIAARDLHGSGNSDAAHEYARQTVKESLMSFAPGDTARHFGKQGLLGPVTPLVTQFMQWNLQVTEKLFREFRDSIGKKRTDETAEQAAERRAASQKFLVGHLVAMTTLAGTLGLPFATVFASALEKILGDEDEPFDATAAWRNFLADIFGKRVGEVLARGAPRAFGFDISSRAGEQNLLPFSDLLADKRPWTDAVRDNVGQGIGAAPNMVLSMLDGGERLANGDVLGGMKAILPTALKNPLEAYRMSTEGYIDTKGNKLPMSPTASAILWQLIGFSPSAKAERSEERGDLAARRGEITRRAGRLRQGIVRALRLGDTDTARDLISEAMQFDAANPGFAVIPDISASLERQQRVEAQSRAGIPVGVSLQDIAGQRVTDYANY